MKKNLFIYYFIFVSYIAFSQEYNIYYEVYTDTIVNKQTVTYTDTSITFTSKGLNLCYTKKILLNEKTIIHSFVNNDSLVTKYNSTYSESFKVYKLINERLIDDGAVFFSHTPDLKRKLRKYKKIKPKIYFTKKEKTILNYRCRNAKIIIEDKIYEVWFTDEIIGINNKTANICSIYSSIKGVILEEYISGKLHKKAVKFE